MVIDLKTPLRNLKMHTMKNMYVNVLITPEQVFYSWNNTKENAHNYLSTNKW